MQHILRIIEARNAQYERHAFIEYLRDERVPAVDRLAYAPFACHFVLTFADFNRYVLRDPQNRADRCQELVNTHSHEDAKHWAWFLDDLAVLGFDGRCRLSDALRFLWDRAGRQTRLLGYWIIALAMDTPPLLRVVIVEAVEAMGNVWLVNTMHAVRQHPNRAALRYFGDYHLERETGHAIGAAQDELRALVIPDDLRPRAEEMVHQLYDRMEAFNAELLARTQEFLASNRDALFPGVELAPGRLASGAPGRAEPVDTARSKE